MRGALPWANATETAASVSATTPACRRRRIETMLDSDSVALPVGAHRTSMGNEGRVGSRVQVLQQVRKRRNGEHRHSLLARELLNGRMRGKLLVGAAPLHPVEGDQDRGRLGPCRADQLDRFALGGAVGDHV